MHRILSMQLSPGFRLNTTQRHIDSDRCKGKCRPIGAEALPEGIITKSSNLEMRPLWGPVSEDNKSKNAPGLLAISAGINQKRLVNEIVNKFLGDDFAVMLFHYDGVVDKWHDLEWSNRVIHVSATNQTKWWFAKRFLHPDIVAEYDYIFLWDEDLGVENFHPGRYLSIIKEEGLEISQPALDPRKSEVHHPITVRRWRSRVHRRFYKFKGGGRCDDNSTSPPCVGWVEMMAPVFSRAAWRCAWYMIQNDLIHAWGLDMKLGYCAQGDRMVKVGVVDEEYIVHLGLPTLGGFLDKIKTNTESLDQPSRAKNLSDSEPLAADMYRFDNRSAVRRQSYNEMMTFRKRWNKAVEEDECWIDPFKQRTARG
ncbi:UNVERIFIED_CONTAM: hypothetical protein Slati_0789900 [Sesamum latifolium]|uniref:Uncharacterized protein n=1 Tax=Sesamum latifolium TaxID=2727402 RepID=A0AAW2XKD6_9LAMI